MCPQRAATQQGLGVCSVGGMRPRAQGQLQHSTTPRCRPRAQPCPVQADGPLVQTTWRDRAGSRVTTSLQATEGSHLQPSLSPQTRVKVGSGVRVRVPLSALPGGRHHFSFTQRRTTETAPLQRKRGTQAGEMINLPVSTLHPNHKALPGQTSI